MEIYFSNPLYLWLLAPIPILIVFVFLSLKRGEMEIEKLVSPHALEFFSKKEDLMSNYIKKNLLFFLFRILIYIIVVFVIAGVTLYYNGVSEKQAIVMAIDASGSMLAEDIEPNRLDAVKGTISVFLEKISLESKIAILSFSGNAYIENELGDREEAIKSIENIEISPISGTSIGAALKTAVNILNEEKKPKLIILMSDGSENIMSKQALDKIIEDVNKEYIKVDVVGIGRIEGAILPGTELRSALNEPLLEDIAKKTNGVYTRAETKQSLTKAYEKLISSTKLKIPIRLTFPLIIVTILLILIDYIFIKVA